MNNAEFIYYFAKGVKGAQLDKIVIEKLVEAIVKTNDAKYMYLFARNVKGTIIEKLAEGIIKTNKAEYIDRFSKAFSLPKLAQSIHIHNIDKNVDDFDEFNAIKIANLSLNDKRKLLEHLYNLLPANQKAILFLQVYEELLTEERCYSLEECRFLDD